MGRFQPSEGSPVAVPHSRGRAARRRGFPPRASLHGLVGRRARVRRSQRLRVAVVQLHDDGLSRGDGPRRRAGALGQLHASHRGRRRCRRRRRRRRPEGVHAGKARAAPPAGARVASFAPASDVERTSFVHPSPHRSTRSSATPPLHPRHVDAPSRRDLSRRRGLCGWRCAVACPLLTCALCLPCQAKPDTYIHTHIAIHVTGAAPRRQVHWPAALRGARRLHGPRRPVRPGRRD